MCTGKTHMKSIGSLSEHNFDKQRKKYTSFEQQNR
jgi:hypothetical protein